MPYRQRQRKPRKSGPMIRTDVVVMTHDGGGEYTEHLCTGYTPYKGCVWAAVKPSWSKFWAVVHADSGYILRRAIKTADQAKVVVERLDRYWKNCTWETVIAHMSDVQHDSYYKRDEYRIRNVNDYRLYWNTGIQEWVTVDRSTVWSKEGKELCTGDYELNVIKVGGGVWEIF